MLDDLISASSDVNTLEEFISDHFDELRDYFAWSTDQDLELNINKFQTYITKKRKTLLELPLTEENLSFLAVLLDTCERLGLIHGFRFLYLHLQTNGYNVGSRLTAASYYMINVRSGDLLIDAFDQMYELLQESYLNEEDNADKVLTTITNYYSKAILDFGNFNIQVAQEIAKKISLRIKTNEYSVLAHPLIFEILKTDLSDFRVAHLHIRSLLDQYLRRGHFKGTVKEGFIIESATQYANELEQVEKDFFAIRQLSVDKHNTLGNQGIFDSLHRGVRIPEQEPQLFAYMTGFGPMHRQKLVSAFIELPLQLYTKKINIIDWGCGQAMGTMCFLDYCNENHIDLEIETVVLIEPSTIALQRGALHVKKYLDCNIVTVNKGLDDLSEDDIEVGAGVNIHLFSNILDIEFFSLNRLISLIKSGYGGKNYFMVVSPYIDDAKKFRINRFVKSFSELKGFKVYSDITQAKYEWRNSWTRISRVFSVDLNFKI
ncbi:hypothetical protein [Fluviicola sp.]|uniref:hypothetical protein n=1 Tax=Fluviicola sp. TaxID=1917219 RepID=UPI0031E28B4E